jgi:hypothetical protein
MVRQEAVNLRSLLKVFPYLPAKESSNKRFSILLATLISCQEFEI